MDWIMRLRVANKNEKLDKGHILKVTKTGEIAFLRDIHRHLDGDVWVVYSLRTMKQVKIGCGIGHGYEFLNGLEKAGIIALLDLRRKKNGTQKSNTSK